MKDLAKILHDLNLCRRPDGEWLMNEVAEKAVSNPDDRASPLGNDHAGMTAERWIEKGCEELSLDRETEVKTPKRSDLRRAAIA